jgi:hypothetical protein
MAFSDLTFDKSFLNFTTDSKKWISIEEKSKLFDLLLKYIPMHIQKDDLSTASYTANVLSCKNKEENLIEDENNKTDIERKGAMGRVALNIGYGQFTFVGYDGEVYNAVFQTIGQPVGTQRGARILRNLVVFTNKAIEQLTKFLTQLIEEDEKTSDGIFTCFIWHIEEQYWRTESKVTARSIESVVIPSAIKSRLIGDLDKFFSPKTTACPVPERLRW